MNIILLGAPNVGKGTQASFISESLGIPSVSTGNILREAMAAGTPRGAEAKDYVNAGRLVPDGLVVALLKERLETEDCAGGFILDGFPRNTTQAEALAKMGVEIDLVISLEAPDEELVKRAGGRRICSCGETYHVEHKPPAVEGKCGKCGGKLFLRDDDRPETVKNRLRVFHEQTEPVKEFYAAKGKVHLVDSRGSVENTTEQTRRIMEAVR